MSGSLTRPKSGYGAVSRGQRIPSSRSRRCVDTVLESAHLPTPAKRRGITGSSLQSARCELSAPHSASLPCPPRVAPNRPRPSPNRRRLPSNPRRVRCRTCAASRASTSGQNSRADSWWCPRTGPDPTVAPSKIAVAGARSTSANPKPDPMLYLAGGPGGARPAAGKHVGSGRHQPRPRFHRHRPTRYVARANPR
ncbi:MAG: hypothetical protein QOI01_3913 [Mycobacterium sp.]|jgi:hypothetical protein|nr:hypothetical protein [Mycobacterium sp.]